MSANGKKYAWKVWTGEDEFKIEAVPHDGELTAIVLDDLQPTAIEELWNALGVALVRGGYELDVEDVVLQAIRKLPVGRDE